MSTQNRNKLILVVLAGLLLAIGLTGCAELPTNTGDGSQRTALTSALESGGESMPRTISTNGIGTASAPPDVALIQLGVETIHTDAAQAISDNTERMTAVMDVLKAMEVEDKDIQTVSYSMWIEQVVDREGQPTGESRYHVVNQVRVRLRDLSKTGEFLQKALEAGANNVGGVSFSVADPTALQGEARDRAIADARAKAQQLATGLGAQLGPIRQASEYGGVVAPSAPVEAYGGGGGPVPVSGGEFSVTVEIQVVYDIAE
jgi:uncharacterized protein YggE